MIKIKLNKNYIEVKDNGNLIADLPVLSLSIKVQKLLMLQGFKRLVLQKKRSVAEIKQIVADLNSERLNYLEPRLRLKKGYKNV